VSKTETEILVRKSLEKFPFIIQYTNQRGQLFDCNFQLDIGREAHRAELFIRKLIQEAREIK